METLSSMMNLGYVAIAGGLSYWNSRLAPTLSSKAASGGPVAAAAAGEQQF